MVWTEDWNGSAENHSEHRQTAATRHIFAASRVDVPGCTLRYGWASEKFGSRCKPTTRGEPHSDALMKNSVRREVPPRLKERVVDCTTSRDFCVVCSYSQWAVNRRRVFIRTLEQMASPLQAVRVTLSAEQMSYLKLKAAKRH